MLRLFRVLFIVLVLSLSAAYGAENDHQLYADVLQKYVKNGLVNYATFKDNRESLDNYLDSMARVDPSVMSRDERLAFYINLYNAATIRLILDNYPVESIKDIGSFFSSPWKKKVVQLNGEMVTLDYIEHGIVRPEFNDPRVHFALNCSAMSCPPLLEVPYEGELIDQQLDDVTFRFINDNRRNYLEGNKLYVSKIFSWFSEDFPDDLVGWISGYAGGLLKQELEEGIVRDKKLRIKYLKYDWSLNELSN